MRQTSLTRLQYKRASAIKAARRYLRGSKVLTRNGMSICMRAGREFWAMSMPRPATAHEGGIDPDKLELARSGFAKKLVTVAAKLLVTGACFWYLSRQVDLRTILANLRFLDLWWAGLAILLAMLQYPLLGLRWYLIVDALGARNYRMTRRLMIAITAIGLFFAQILPSMAGEGIRAWLLTRNGCNWGDALTSVVIDRGVGIGILVLIGFAALLLPSGQIALGEYRDVVLVAYSGLLLTGVLGLVFAMKVARLLGRWRTSRWLGCLVGNVYQVLLGPLGVEILAIGLVIQGLMILTVWSLGWAQGLLLPPGEAALLFTVMIGITLVPVSISGWGLRELAVISLLGSHGIAPERALFFSVCFGLVAAISALPGALVWLIYRTDPAWSGNRPSCDETSS
jgi:uncharacterized membrane protein YbhN (UPF0104 family)